MDDDETDPWQRVYNLIAKGHSDIGVRLDRIERGLTETNDRLERGLADVDTRLNGMELVANERDQKYTAHYEELRRLVAKRVASKEAPAPKRRRPAS